MTPNAASGNSSAEELHSKLHHLQNRRRELARELIAATDGVRRKSLEQEIQHLKKRESLIQAALQAADQQEDSDFSHFANYKYGHLSAEETQALNDLAELLEVSADQLQRDFATFAQISKASKRKSLLMDAIARQRAKLAQKQKLEEELSEAQQALEELKAQLSSQQAISRQLTSEKQAAEQLATRRERQLEEVQQQFQEERHHFEQEREQLYAQIQQLRSESLAYRQDVEDAAEELASLRKDRSAEIESLQQALAEAKQTSQLQQDQTAMEREEIAQLRAENETMRQQFSVISAELRTTTDEAAKLIAEEQLKAETYEQQAATLHAQVAALKKEKDKLQSEHRHLQTQLAKVHSEMMVHWEKSVKVFTAHRERWEGDEIPQFAGADETFYGYLIATLWNEINQTSGAKSPKVLEQRLQELLSIPTWHEQYASLQAQRTIRDVNRYQQCILKYGSKVPIAPAQSFPDLYRLVAQFFQHCELWKAEWEFEAFERNAHPDQAEIYTALKQEKVPLSEVTFEDFVRCMPSKTEDLS